MFQICGLGAAVTEDENFKILNINPTFSCFSIFSMKNKIEKNIKPLKFLIHNVGLLAMRKTLLKIELSKI